ncbi:MAG: single-stranded-DNA-specific exonuclease RecJ [Candidatus Omnitrophota bacterium]|jgi:single-stranded-DNA-specific exonuclease
MHTRKILHIASPNRSLREGLSKELGISYTLAQLLINRGIDTPGAAEKFLNPSLGDLLDPYSFLQMPHAVDIIRRAGKEKKKILIFSDYDVDGLTSLTLLESTFAKIGLDTCHYIPDRVKEGYGLNKKVLQLVKEKQVKVVITADCGTNSDEQIKELRHMGVEVVVTDHHEPLESHSHDYASAMINPKSGDSGYRYRDLAGVGVAYKFCQALSEDVLAEELDLVALGTIADAVPLTGENRIIAKEGLGVLFNTKRLGLKTLIEASGIKNKKINPGFVSFILGPRINASGRIDNAEVALSLLMSADQEEAERLVETVEKHNRQRQRVESTILEEAQAIIDKEVNFKEHKVMVVAKEGWHTGVLGIVAARLAERFYRPTILISLAEGICKGSGRSIKNFHLFEAILECSDLLENFGGHQHATGLSLTKENIDQFRNKINSLAHERLTLTDLMPSIDIDMELSLSDLDEAFVRELERLEPFGMGNRQPLFFTGNLRLKGQPRVMGRDTLKFWVTDGTVTYQAIGFGMGSFKDGLLAAEYFDMVYSPVLNNWQGEESLVLEIKEIFFK